MNEDIMLSIRKIAYKVLRRLPPSIELDDLIQEGFLAVMEAARTYDESKGASFKSFSTIRAHGAMVDFVRREAAAHGWDRVRKQRHKALVEDEPSLDDNEALEELATRDAVRLGDLYSSRLTPRDRFYVEMRFKHDMKLTAIGVMLGITESAASQGLARALNKMKAAHRREEA